MQIFKLTPKPQSDYRLDINEIKKKCTVEKHGYRHDKIIFGFCDELPDITELQSLGLKIEEVAFDKARVSLMSDLVERGRTKSKIDHLKHEQTENGEKNEPEEALAQKKLAGLNDNIQATKEALGITGTLKVLKL
ncbi:MAG: hypothetical protein V7750_12450 [Sneathiella sp.]